LDDTVLSLAEGWNLVGYLPSIGYYDTSSEPDPSLLYATPTSWIQKPEPVYNYVLSSIAGKWRVVIGARPGGAAISADSTLPPLLNNLHDFEPGNGYWIKTYNAVDLIYDSPTGAVVSKSTGAVVPPHKTSVKPTNLCMFIYGTVTLDGKPARKGEPIAIYDIDGTVVGEGVIREDGMYGLVAVYGDEPYAASDEGARAGETLLFEVNGLKADSITRVIWNGNSEVVKVDLVVKSRPSNQEVGQNFPNPFNPETWIPYQLSDPAQVVIKIYNVRGQSVRTLDLGQKEAGYYMTKARASHWDGRNTQGERVASGVYFYTIKAGSFVATKRFVMLK